MGIPKFFRWLTRRYPLILQNVKLEEDFPPIDNMYLDLNGIVHNCIHGNDAKRHERVSQLGDNLDEVWLNIMKAIDELVHSVKPTKILFLAVDGVAPRAKMNQQRSRRFRSAKDSIMLKQQLENDGKQAPELFDSNAISPGTKFMFELNRQLEFFVKYKINTDPLYQKLERIVLSDSSIPGEGEHKMMDFIRQAKSQENYNPNTRHCFYGADADLIMLSLVTHEPHFFILREEHIVRKVKQGGVQRLDLQKTNNFQVIYINLLREYFMLEYAPLATQMKMPFSIERIIDDFVFFCFFIGNDFLPSLSSLDISEGSLDHLILMYQQNLPLMTDYITNAGMIYWDRAEPFINMLGEHEHEAFKKRMQSIQHAYHEKIVSFSEEFGNMKTSVDKKQIVQMKIREKLQEKKQAKILHMTKTRNHKHVKKFLLLKKLDDEDMNESLTFRQKQARDKLLSKYKRIREKQWTEDVRSDSVLQEESKQAESLRDIINEVREEYFSDVQVEDINDGDVSEVDESELNLDEIPDVQQSSEMDQKIKIQQQIVDKYAEANIEFMTQFISTYARDPPAAKALYYLRKVKIDVGTPQGQDLKKRMLKKYLEGLQWVLFYYYRGAQHWRWYYPYHYAPMISDLEENIVQNYLDNNNTIETFETDVNCSDVNYPYTPFQQLLSILPTKSINLLPKQYHPIFYGELAPFFPADFEIDLNGRALPWEAATLIPFVDEKQMLQHEGLALSLEGLDDDNTFRNTISFRYRSYNYDEQIKVSGEKLTLKSTLKIFQDLPYNLVSSTIHSEYEDVGKHSFVPKLLRNVIIPEPNFPSFLWAQVMSITYDEKIINHVPFKRVLLKIPQVLEDTKDSEYLETVVSNYVNDLNKELYIGFPFQQEAFPNLIENDKYTFAIFYDNYTGACRYRKDYQQLDNDKLEGFQRRMQYRMQDSGFQIDNPKTYATFNRVSGVSFDNNSNVFYKVYSEEQETLPWAMVIKRRSPLHYLNVNDRCNSILNSFKLKQEAVCLNMQMFGVIGTVADIDDRKNKIKLHFDKVKEEGKIHDPFMGQKCLSKQGPIENQDVRRYYTDREIESILKMRGGLVNRITGSVLVTFNDKVKFEPQVLDLGLNVKNFTKKVHIPDFVRFVEDWDSLADYQNDSYHHNQHARSTKHVRKHWEYSQECFDIIKTYYERHYEIFDLLFRTMKQNKHMFNLKDIYLKQDLEHAQDKVRAIARWIEQLPISNLPYVEMGFDALHQNLIRRLVDQKSQIQTHYKQISLKCSDVQFLDSHMIYQETFPFWTAVFSGIQLNEYNVGDRVMNINSSKRDYVPFGLRGTVVGKTNEKVIVLFDEQYIGGNDIYGHCDPCRGGFVNPAYLINLTQKFTKIIKKNQMIVEGFTEQPLFPEELGEVLQLNQQLSQPNPVKSSQFEESKVMNSKSTPFVPLYATKKKEASLQQPMYVVKTGSKDKPQATNQDPQAFVDNQTSSIPYQQNQFITESLLVNTIQANQQPITQVQLSHETYAQQIGNVPDYRVDDAIEDDVNTHEAVQQVLGSLEQMVVNPSLVNNPDFQQLMNMLSVASTINQQGIFGPLGGQVLPNTAQYQYQNNSQEESKEDQEHNQQ